MIALNGLPQLHLSFCKSGENTVKVPQKTHDHSARPPVASQRSAALEIGTLPALPMVTHPDRSDDKIGLSNQDDSFS
jgi:hypothetical protein